MRVLVTGGAGFIGSALVRQLITETQSVVITLDKLTYAGRTAALGSAQGHPRHRFEQVDIADSAEVARVFHEHRPDAVIHLAAETHVDRSIADSQAFVRTNVTGTHTLLEAARDYWQGLEGEKGARFRFLHVSTDEVYGDLGLEEAPFRETDPYAPSSPYAATKAAGDHLVRAWHRTYGLPVVVTNCTNNYGPYQYPEKLIPLTIAKALKGQPIPLYGEGDQVRDWLYVTDHARALRRVLAEGRVGRTYNIAGGSERTNAGVVRSICDHLDRLAPDPEGSYERWIRFVTDRPGHDRRYGLDTRRIAAELKWCPEESFETGLEHTVRWYLVNSEWLAPSGQFGDR